ncbi:MAG: MFS transporter [Gammaproteobacteria bacterium]|nr:MFS transporter [Gammaproteobacteria bacterium]
MLPFKTKFGWGIGTLTVSLMFQANGLLLLVYLTDFVNLNATTAGLLIGLSKIYDAVTDPVMGRISDRTNTSWGKRRPYVLLGTILCALSFILLFNLALFSDSQNIVLITLLALMLNATGYTIFNVPYLAMPAEITTDYNARTDLMSYRVMAVAAGQLGGSAMGPALVVYFGSGVIGHSSMANTLAIIMIIAGVCCVWMTKNAPFVNPEIQKRETGSFFQQFKTAFQIKPFAILLGIKVTQLTGFAIFLGSLPYLFTRVMELSYNYLGFYFLIQGSVMLISQPAWVNIVNKVGKKNSYYLASLSWGLGALSWMFVSKGITDLEIIIRGIFLGIGAGGLILVGQSMLPDTMQYDFQKSGNRREGILAGVYTTVEKFSFAIGPSILGIMLGLVGYEASTNVFSENVIRMIYFTAGGFPVISLLISCLLMIIYNVDQKLLKKNN